MKALAKLSIGGVMTEVKREPGPLTRSERVLVTDALREGERQVDIAKAIGCSRAAVVRVARKENLRKRDRPR